MPSPAHEHAPADGATGPRVAVGDPREEVSPVSQAQADRNLLFGILAVQMDFVRRNDLLAALGAWVRDKAKPLGRVLVEQKALGEDAHTLLEALVRKHL